MVVVLLLLLLLPEGIVAKDNFYDQDGEISKDFFSRVSQNVKRRFWMVVNGNHDNWVCGFPACGGRSDNFGIGQMQYYPMDSVASGEGNKLFDFVDPDGNRHWNSFLNNGTNFFFYHKLGNVGFLGYSGAAQYEETLPQLHACVQLLRKIEARGDFFAWALEQSR